MYTNAHDVNPIARMTININSPLYSRYGASLYADGELKGFTLPRASAGTRYPARSSPPAHRSASTTEFLSASNVSWPDLARATALMSVRSLPSSHTPMTGNPCEQNTMSIYNCRLRELK